jgi:hypothetical protein
VVELAEVLVVQGVAARPLEEGREHEDAHELADDVVGAPALEEGHVPHVVLVEEQLVHEERRADDADADDGPEDGVGP